MERRDSGEVIADFRFIPAGRVLAGAGTERTVTLFDSCSSSWLPAPDSVSDLAARGLEGGCAGHAQGGGWKMT